MKRLLILAALGSFLAAHGVVRFMSIYPPAALSALGGYNEEVHWPRGVGFCSSRWRYAVMTLHSQPTLPRSQTS